ncbi:MAG: M24 family metallopeptidase [Coprobacillaceae bacterium]
MAKHIQEYKRLIETHNMDALLIKSKTVKKHLSTLTGSGVLILITKDKDYMILDGRYIIEAKENEKDLEIVLNTPAASKKSHYDIVMEIMDQHNYTKLGIEVAGFSILDVEKLKNYHCTISYLQEEIDQLRVIKDQEEISILKEACILTDEIFKETIQHIHVGITENEICAYLHYYAYKKGTSRMSFDPVVTSGPRTALAHGRPSNRQVQAGEPIMMDFGIEYQGYQSDMTRMVFMGKPSKKIIEMYSILKEAQTLGVKQVKSGCLAKAVDKEVRDFIIEKGYGEYFDHGLGHGIGIGDGREYPYLNQTSTTVLKDGMIMSVEPGIYIPGVGGIRIEDDVLIQNGIGIPLNNTSKEMWILEE